MDAFTVVRLFLNTTQRNLFTNSAALNNCDIEPPNRLKEEVEKNKHTLQHQADKIFPQNSKNRRKTQSADQELSKNLEINQV
jgi:hypothetical protein